MDRATDSCPSRLQDWLYCCEPSSTRGFLVFGSTVTTSFSWTTPVTGGVGPLGLVRLVEPVMPPGAPVVAGAVPDMLAPAWVGVDLPVAVLTMMLANSSGSVRRPRVLIVS